MYYKSILQKIGILSLCYFFASNAMPLQAQDQNIPSPKSYFGFKMGADYKLAHWDKLVKYYDELGDKSPRMKVVHMGESTLGNPFLALYISSPENLANLDELQKINAMLSDPRGFSEAEIEAGTWFTQKRFIEVCEEIEKEIGNITSLKYISTLNRKSSYLTLWKSTYSKSKDEVLWQIIFDIVSNKIKLMHINWEKAQ